MRLFSTAFSHFLINLLQIFHQTGGGGGGGPSGLSPESAPGVTDLFFVPSQTLLDQVSTVHKVTNWKENQVSS